MGRCQAGVWAIWSEMEKVKAFIHAGEKEYNLTPVASNHRTSQS